MKQYKARHYSTREFIVRALIGGVIGWTIGEIFNRSMAKMLKTLGDHKNLLTLEDKAVLQNFLDTDPFGSGIWDGRPETAREGRTIADIAQQTIAKLERENQVFLYPNSPRSILESFKDKIDDFKDFVDSKINAREYRLLQQEVDEERADLPLDVESGLNEVLHPSQRIGNGWDDLNLSPTPEQSPEDIKNHGAF